MNKNDSIEMNSNSSNNHLRISSEEAVLLIIDVQDKLIASIRDNNLIEWNIRRLIESTNVLGIQRYFTEQNPTRLGPTSTSIATELKDTVYPKMSFSCITCNKLIKNLKERHTKKIIVCGVETHVCILQSALDLLEEGFQVFIPIDAIGSRNEIDHKTAIRRLELAGVITTTTESIIFEWCKTSDRVEFKAISAIIKKTQKASFPSAQEL